MIGGHGMIALEQRVMDLHDDGRSPKQIAAALGITHRRASSIVGTYRITPVDRFEANARTASAALLERLLAYQARHGATA